MKDPTRIVRSVSGRLARAVYPLYKRPVVVLFRYTKALGDALMLTTLAHEVRKRNPDALIHVITGLPSLFDRNPDVNFVNVEPDRPMPGLGRHLIRYEHRFPWHRHLLYYCADCIGLPHDFELRTYIYPSEEDERFAEEFVARAGRPPVLVSRTGGPRTNKKNYPEAHWKSVVEQLLEHHVVVDIGGPGSPEFPGNHPNFHSLLGRTTFHQLAAVMKRSALLVSPVTGTLHLAAATGLRSLAIVGGSEPAAATEYPGGSSLVNRPDCADCYEKHPCHRELECLWKIRPEAVYAVASRMLMSHGSNTGS